MEFPEYVVAQAKQRLRRGPQDDAQTIIYLSVPKRSGKQSILREIERSLRMRQVPDSKELFAPLAVDTREHFPEEDD